MLAFDLWHYGVPSEKVKPLKYFNCKSDIKNNDLKNKHGKALSQMKTVVSHVQRHLVTNYISFSNDDKDVAVKQAYDKLVQEIKTKEQEHNLVSRKRNYDTMNYSSMYKLLSECKLLSMN